MVDDPVSHAVGDDVDVGYREVGQLIDKLLEEDLPQTPDFLVLPVRSDTVGRGPAVEEGHAGEVEIVGHLRGAQCSFLKAHVVTMHEDEKRLRAHGLQLLRHFPASGVRAQRYHRLQDEVLARVDIALELPQRWQLELARRVSRRNADDGAAILERTLEDSAIDVGGLDTSRLL